MLWMFKFWFLVPNPPSLAQKKTFVVFWKFCIDGSKVSCEDFPMLRLWSDPHTWRERQWVAIGMDKESQRPTMLDWPQYSPGSQELRTTHILGTLLIERIGVRKARAKIQTHKSWSSSYKLKPLSRKETKLQIVELWSKIPHCISKHLNRGNVWRQGVRFDSIQ